jgi:hypothetical protein
MPSNKAAANQLFALWEVPLRMSAQWCELWFAMLPSHRLTGEERDDKAHAQLIVPEPLKAVEDRDLFA